MRLADLQEQLARALVSAEPERELSDLGLDPQGLRLAATIILKLRFDRVMRAEARYRELYDRDPDGFTRDFLAYHREVPPQAYFPAEEAALWESFLRHRQADSL